MKYVANPVEVEAFRITAVHEAADGDSLILTLESHDNVYTRDLFALFQQQHTNNGTQ